MSTEQSLSTTQLLTLILTELKAINAALRSGGRTSQPPARQPAQNQNSGGQTGGKYAMKPGEEFATCNRCGANNVIWRTGRNSGKSYLVNEDGAYHFTTCTGGQ